MTGTVDLRSDTVTTPTEAMREAMRVARVGDDGYSEDPTVSELQELAASILGKEAALYVPSGKMGNMCAVMTHTDRRGWAVCEALSHIGYQERRNFETFSNVEFIRLTEPRGLFEPKALAEALTDAKRQGREVRLVCLENTHNMSGGTVSSVQKMAELCRVAHEHGCKVHLDGARVWNAAAALGVDVRELVRDVDSVMACLSKGLAAPVGSMLAGPKEFIQQARQYRMMLGGQMRQAGVIAAAGIVALKTMRERLVEDHANARLLAEDVASLPGIQIDLDRIRTNIVMFWMKDGPPAADRLVAEVRKADVWIRHFGEGKIRAVVHKDVARDGILRARDAIRKAMVDG
jgi:threonine aldolase